jgi:ABC-type lipoprotein release transport system permease subunit
MIRSTMAMRNTLRQPRRTLLLGAAIAFGVMIICLASGFTSGMDKAVQNNVTLFSAGHVLVSGISASESGRAQNRISDATLAEKAKQILPEAISVSETAQAQATVVFGSREQQLRVRGVDWASDKLFSQSLILTEGSWTQVKTDRSIVLGAQSARRFGLGLGDSVFVKLSTVSGQQNVTEYKLGGVYDDGAAGGMTTALVPLANLLADLNMKDGQYQSLAIFLPDASQAEAASAKLTAGLKKDGFLMINAAAAGSAIRQFANNQAPTSTTVAGSASTPATSSTAAPATTVSSAAQTAPAGASTAQKLARRAARQLAAGGGKKAAGNLAANGQGTAALPGASGAAAQTASGAPAQTAGGTQTAGGGIVIMNGAGNPAGDSGGGAGGFGRGLMGQLFGNAPPGTTAYRVATVTELSGQMGAVLGSVRWIGITIFLIMLVLVAAGITNTYRMVLMERTKEIGMLRCIGFRRKDVFRIFIYEAGLIAVAGSLAGIIVSLPIGFLVHLIPFNPSGSLGSALARGRLTFAPQFISLALVCVAVIAASVLAVFGPARKASKLLPVEALRTTA